MKAAFVIPWYGPDIPGGAEAECRRTAENLVQRGAEVEILTTCLRSLEASWDRNHHRPGETMVNGVPVRRFPVDSREPAVFGPLNERLMRGESLNPAQQRAFFESMVNSRALYDFIAQARDRLFLPIPYLFSTTWRTLKLRPESSVPIACLHDEGYAYMDLVREAFNACRGVIFHTRAEFELAQDLWGLGQDKALLFGEGIDTAIAGEGRRFREKFKLDEPFILYAGRRDATKNTPLLLDLFAAYKRARGGRVKLALMGNLPFKRPEGLEAEIVDLGFLDAQDKADALSAADLFCQPSVNESFSIVIMEAWLCHTPVLVHADCPATREHVEASKGGFTFRDLDGFGRAVDQVLADPAGAAQMAQAGREYVLKNFHWDVICRRYMDLLARAERPPAPRPKARPAKGPAVHQVLSHFSFGDAIGNEALLIRRRLQDQGLKSQIYADFIDARVRRQARELERFKAEAGPDDLVLWHFSTGTRLVDWLQEVRQRLVMRYHNITPDKYFRGVNERAALDVRWGRHQLDRMAERVELALGVSEFNRAELEAAGYRRTAVAPYVMEIRDFSLQEPGPLAERLGQGGPNILHVGRLAPQKKIEDLIRAFYFLKKLKPEARLILVGGGAGFEPYLAGLEALVRELGLEDVHFAGQVGLPDLVAYYSLAQAYLCLSEHEGFCVPLIEAMSVGLPVVARAAAAVPETLGSAGILLQDPSPSQVAEALNLLAEEPDLVRAVVAGQRARLEELRPEAAWARMWSLLEPLLGRAA